MLDSRAEDVCGVPVSEVEGCVPVETPNTKAEDDCGVPASGAGLNHPAPNNDMIGMLSIQTGCSVERDEQVRVKHKVKIERSRTKPW